MSKINWPELMKAGLSGLRLSPEGFWALTPAELMLMLGANDGAAALRREGLNRLMTAFPDEQEGPCDD